jgi:hypothetical protein
MMKITKSTRHAKIAGDFGESLVLYWLSKHGFECAKIDHTGIDLIASRTGTKERFGISVKARTRLVGTERTNLIMSRSHFVGIEKACHAFGLKPYLAIVVEAGEVIHAYIMPLALAQKHCTSKADHYWKMTEDSKAKYKKDRGIMKFDLKINQGHWWGFTPDSN